MKIFKYLYIYYSFNNVILIFLANAMKKMISRTLDHHSNKKISKLLVLPQNEAWYKYEEVAHCNVPNVSCPPLGQRNRKWHENRKNKDKQARHSRSHRRRWLQCARITRRTREEKRRGGKAAVVPIRRAYRADHQQLVLARCTRLDAPSSSCPANQSHSVKQLSHQQKKTA